MNSRDSNFIKIHLFHLLWYETGKSKQLPGIRHLYRLLKRRYKLVGCFAHSEHNLISILKSSLKVLLTCFCHTDGYFGNQSLPYTYENNGSGIHLSTKTPGRTYV